MTVKEAEYVLEDTSEDNDASDNMENHSDDSDKDSNDGSMQEDDDNETGANTAWADSVSKILNTNKPKRKKGLVLSKAKKLTDIKQEKPEKVEFEIEVKEEKLIPETISSTEKEVEPPRKKRKKETSNLRIKPNILDRDRERTLAKIATRGVVQLFNSVRMQQKDINAKLDEAGPLISKREKVLKSIDKRAFLDVLMGEKSQPVDGPVKNELKEQKNDTKVQSTWNVLRDDFMLSAKFKDWDKDTNLKDESNEEETYSSD